ncbi:hypothetical protein FKM82_028463 [Ascaphus truei]
MVPQTSGDHPRTTECPQGPPQDPRGTSAGKNRGPHSCGNHPRPPWEPPQGPQTPMGTTQDPRGNHPRASRHPRGPPGGPRSTAGITRRLPDTHGTPAGLRY